MNVALHTIECFAGVGMLGVGLHAGLGHLGIETRTVCYVEREAFAASVMAARMAEGALDDAPVWSDVTSFDAHAWRGAVDCVIGGFPCQDLSLAGRRAGLDGKRSGLFFAPGPADARWPAILREWPGLAPALDKTAESGLRGVADGLADRSHDCRAQRLKCVGNGVVALQAAAAAVVLVRRMMETA